MLFRRFLIIALLLAGCTPRVGGIVATKTIDDSVTAEEIKLLAEQESYKSIDGKYKYLSEKIIVDGLTAETHEYLNNDGVGYYTIYRRTDASGNTYEKRVDSKGFGDNNFDWKLTHTNTTTPIK